MEISILLKNSIITSIELHVSCVLLIALLFHKTRASFIRNGRMTDKSLYFAYFGSMLMIIADCTWTAISSLDISGNFFGYFVNLVYFVSSAVAVMGWFAFSTKELGTKFSKSKTQRVMAHLPGMIVIVLYLISPFYGLVFSIVDGEYVRGSLFFLDPLIKMGYIGAASVIAVVKGSKREIEYLKRNDIYYALFGVPVVILGILQTMTGVDFNCLGVTSGLILVYILGITDQDSENTNAIYSLANSFDASYIVNIDTGKIRPLREDAMHDRNTPGMRSMNYANHFPIVLSSILLPEDKEDTLEAFELKNIEERFKIDNSYSIRYRVKEKSGRTVMHSASFIKATDEDGKHEFLLGVNTINSDSLLYERNETLSHENERLEQINTNIIESVAKIVEARDGGSGEHIVRVRKITEMIAKAVMEDYPEYKLDDERVKMISSASVLHDVGKIAIPDAILLKPGRLTKEEFEIMKTHSAKGCDILNTFPMGLDDAFFECALSICRWHHEKYDGKGYPDGLVGDEIPIAAQIVAAADCFDALVSERPYKKAFSPEVALEMVANGECGVFSPKIINSMEKEKNRLMELARLYR